jgi:hypothetical protein
MTHEEYMDRFHDYVNALAATRRMTDEGTLFIRLSAGTAPIGHGYPQEIVSIYRAFALWLRERPELITEESVYDLITNPVPERIKLFKQFAAFQVAYEEMVDGK